jgi:hypothetical protein
MRDKKKGDKMEGMEDKREGEKCAEKVSSPSSL